MQDININDPTQNVFRALSDPTRRAIVTRLSQKDMTIAEVADGFDITRHAIKKHLIILEQGQLITVRKQGREKINHLEPAVLKKAHDWLEPFSHFWDDRLASLKNAVEQNKKGKTS